MLSSACRQSFSVLSTARRSWHARPAQTPRITIRTMSHGHKQPDYTTYTHADLLQRVSDLEAQLRRLNVSHESSTPASAPGKKLRKKAHKTFDPSKYTTRLIALKFAYLGGAYNGFEHHANNTTPLPTVEEELWRALRKTKLIFPEFGGRSEDEVCWDGCEYSKCGRTDRGVSAFGQVVGLRVRSSRPKAEATVDVGSIPGEKAAEDDKMRDVESAGLSPITEQGAFEHANRLQDWHSVRDELPYMQLLNHVLPTDIRVLAWCPHPPPNFSARFSCKERRYRYFFTNPAYATPPGPKSGEGWLDIEAMRKAARKLEGLHDFRNLCKVDPSKQITNFERRVFHADIHAVSSPRLPDSHLALSNGDLLNGEMPPIAKLSEPALYYFEVRGSAFLWHQVRHLVAVLFLVGQGYEQPSLIDHLLDIEGHPRRPFYDMADDRPLVLWDCIFPNQAQLLLGGQHQPHDGISQHDGYEDGLDWVYVGDDAGNREPSRGAVDEGKFGRNGIMDELWALWQGHKINEVLAGSLMDVVERQGRPLSPTRDVPSDNSHNHVRSDRVFDGSERPRPVGRYVPVMQREKMEPVEVINARYTARKGLPGKRVIGDDGQDMDE
ncbi:hypothetical protein BAUCODRAFT_175867 [Baudoinia panamericana UAMH 10762]|uniref:Pseudouridine synthase I TruA alpha/beta domain-containing protein n=1 Tax=Baudoinia panamericana (strain UAMH 10762) TaxID=717646 RepID=M2N8Y6_BAUPA|nr:uncharacterized protein BAUCODRAFT_175867 [Baudoinia panamericana UAMH 10762]EMD00614.1 hypothetical protein BAUCODRAFT_175867 [Baudoinia panamericana UAMH 10762]